MISQDIFYYDLDPLWLYAYAHTIWRQQEISSGRGKFIIFMGLVFWGKIMAF